jgi:hypothetical protein
LFLMMSSSGVNLGLGGQNPLKESSKLGFFACAYRRLVESFWYSVLAVYPLWKAYLLHLWVRNWVSVARLACIFWKHQGFRHLGLNFRDCQNFIVEHLVVLMSACHDLYFFSFALD